MRRTSSGILVGVDDLVSVAEEVIVGNGRFVAINNSGVSVGYFSTSPPVKYEKHACVENNRHNKVKNNRRLLVIETIDLNVGTINKFRIPEGLLNNDIDQFSWNQDYLFNFFPVDEFFNGTTI